jgi:large subunit ribosomal protein L18
MLLKQEKRKRRHRRVRAKVFGTKEVPRLCVFRSSRHIYAQLVDDEEGKTLVAVSDLKLKLPKQKAPKSKGGKEEGNPRTGKVAKAFEVGKLIAKEALNKGIKKVVFDRGGYKYHGRVKAVAEGAREGGLEF